MTDHVPDNDFTRLIDSISADNRAGGRRGGVASATPLPTVRSASYGQEVVVPLTAEQQAELDRKAAELGIMELPMHASGFVPNGLSPVITLTPRLPNFRAVEGIDLQRNVVAVDGLAFPIPEDEALELRQYVLRIVRTALEKKLKEALDLLSLPTTAEDTNGGTAKQEEPVPPVQQFTAGSSSEPEV